MAARQMDLTPARVTRAAQSLEERVGMRLLKRTTRRMRLTQTGERYLQTVRRMLVEIEDALRLSADGRLVLGAPARVAPARSVRALPTSLPMAA